MPIGLSDPIQADPDALDQGAAVATSPWQAYGEAFHAGATDLTGRAAQWLGDQLFGRGDQLSADEANDRYGVPGALRFNALIGEDDAAFRHNEAIEQQYQGALAARSNASPLGMIGASFGGSLFDPLGLAVMAGTDGVGTFAKGALGLESAADAANVARSGFVANAASTAGEFGRTALTGAAMNAPFVGLDAYLRHDVGDDMSLGEASQDLALGAIFHTGLHYAGRLFADRGGVPGEVSPAPGGEDAAMTSSPQPSFMPDPVQALPIQSRTGAWLKAVDDLADDRPVDVAQHIEREAAMPSQAALDELTAEPQVAGRWLDPAVAVTPHGTEIPVRYGLVDMGDLITSHTNDFQPNPAFPPELQPRDRSMLGAMARNYQLEQQLNPKLLMNDVSAAAGAPIVAPDGVVESGNGRVIALRRSSEANLSRETTVEVNGEKRTLTLKGGDAYNAYRAELERQGFDTSGFERPVLVRMRAEPLSGAQRGALARDMNSDVTERMSATEQARADATAISDDDLAKTENPLTDAGFHRAFLQKVAPDQVNQLVDQQGRLNSEGKQRLRRAVVARAFGALPDAGAASEAFHDGMAGAAPAWARMRAMAARGEIPAQLDLTPNLNSAFELVAAARDARQALGGFLAERFGQTDIFAGEAIAPETEAFLRMLYSDQGFTNPRAPGKIAWALSDYARQAMEVTPGPDLFGDSPDGSTARAILAELNRKFADGDAGRIDLRAPGRAAGPDAQQAAGDAVIDLPAAGRAGSGGDGSGIRPEGGEGAGRPGGRPADHSGVEPRRQGAGPAAGLSVEREIAGQTVAFHDAAQASVYDLGRKLNAAGGAADAAAKAEIEAMRHSIGPYLDFSDYSGRRAKFDADGAPSAWLMTAYARDLAREVEADPATASLSLYDPDRAGELAGRAIAPTPIAGEPSGEAATQEPDADEKPAGAADRQDADGQAAPGAGGGAGEGEVRAPSAERLVAADPELKALAEDTRQLAALHGLADEPQPDADRPDSLVKAMRAAASCLIDAAGEVF